MAWWLGGARRADQGHGRHLLPHRLPHAAREEGPRRPRRLLLRARPAEALHDVADQRAHRAARAPGPRRAAGQADAGRRARHHRPRAARASTPRPAIPSDGSCCATTSATRRQPKDARRSSRSSSGSCKRRPGDPSQDDAVDSGLPALRYSSMRFAFILTTLVFTLANSTVPLAAQDLSFREMRWRDIGPTRAGRARALAGVASQPNIFYAGFDNGGVWRSTDYGANWVPLFDDQSTGSIGAIAVAPSNPNVIYVGTGAGIIRPDLAIGDGMYKSTDAGTHVAASRAARQPDDRGDRRRSRQRRPAVRRRARPPVRPERRARRVPLDRRRTDLREGAVQGRLHQRQRRAASTRAIPTSLYATLWQQQQSFIEGQGFGGAGNGHLQVDRRRHDLDAARRGAAGRSCRRTSRSRRAIRTSSTPTDRAGTGTDRLLQVHRRRRALVPGDSRPGRAGGTGAGHAAARAHRRRRPADGHRRSQESERRLQPRRP